MGEFCVFDPFEECFRDCEYCPRSKWNGEEYDFEYDPYDGYDREETVERNY